MCCSKHTTYGFLVSQKHSLLQLLLLLCAREHKRHRLSAICIPETHEANLHKCSASCMPREELDLWLMLPSTGAHSVPFAYSNDLISRSCISYENIFVLSQIRMHLYALTFWFSPPPDIYSVPSHRLQHAYWHFRYL